MSQAFLDGFHHGAEVTDREIEHMRPDLSVRQRTAFYWGARDASIGDTWRRDLTLARLSAALPLFSGVAT